MGLLVHRLLFFFLLCMGVIFLIAAMQFPMTVTGGLLGPGFFPQVISGLIVLLVLFHLGRLFVKRYYEKTEGQTIYEMPVFKKHLFFLLSLIVTFILIEYIGMFLSLGLFMIVILKTFEKMSWIRSIVFSIIIMLFLYLVFIYWLELVIPTGTLFN